MNSEIKINYLDINSNNAVPANKNICTVKKSNLYNNIPIVDLSSEQRDIVQITDQSISRKNVGGKGSALYRMQQAGMLVPEFTTINVKSIENLEQHSLDITSLKPFINDITSFNLAEVNIANIKQYIQNRYSNQPEQRNLYLQDLASFIASDSFYQQISNSQTAESIRENYNQLIASLAEDSAIIVRSSGIKEDNYGDAQAGKFESLVHGKQDIVLTCLQVLASGFEPHVYPFSAPQPMSLIIQRCIDCSFGGVAMSRTSLKDHRGKIEFVPGQPKGGVSGVAGVTPHTYLVTEENDKFRSDFTEGNVTSQFILKQQDNNNFEEKPVALTENSSVHLTEEQLKQIYQYIKQGEDMLLCPVDFEFAIAKDSTVYALQLRPLTVLTGGVNFAIDPPENPITTGTLISEGFCAGELFYVQSEQDADLVPQGAIVVANHGETWMVDNNQFFKKVGGFIFQQGGANDHIAITMRQQEKPYLVTTDNFNELKNSNAIVSLACGNFKENPGAYVTTGSEFADKLATLQSTVKADYQLRSSEKPVRQTPVLYFNRPDIAFKNLHDLNYILLDYFSADSWLTRCFTEKSMLLLSMAPHRIKIIKEAKQEIQQLFADFELFLSGYQQYLQLGIQPETDREELQQKLAEAEKLTAEFNDIKTRANNHIDNILQQFTNVANQTIPKGDFSQLLQNTTKIFTDMQKLNIPKTIDEINSLHDIILWIHQEFINDLLPVAINSHLGIITKYEKVISIIFSDIQENIELETICVNALKDLKSLHKPKVVIMENAIIAIAKLGNHACTIEMLEDAGAGKERTLRLRLSDNFMKNYNYQGKLKRFWFFTQLLHNIGFADNASAIKISVEESTGILTITILHIKTTEIMFSKLSDLITVLNSIKDIDLFLNYSLTSQENINWDFSILKQKLADITSIENQQYFDKLIVRYCCQFEVNEFIYLNTNKFNQLFEIISILKSKKNISLIEIEHLFKYIDGIDQEKLFFYLLEANIISIIDFVKIKHPDWFEDKEVILKLLAINGMLFKYVGLKLSNDPSVALLAISKNIKAVQYIGQKLINDNQFILNFIEIIKNTSDDIYLNYNYIPSEILKNKDVLLAVFAKNPNLFNILHHKFKPDWLIDKETLIKLVSIKGQLLEFVEPELCNDINIVLPAITQDIKAIQYVGQDLIKKDKFILQLIECINKSYNDDGFDLEDIPSELLANEDVLLAIVSKYPEFYYKLTEVFKLDWFVNKEIMIKLVSLNGLLLKYATRLRNDSEVVLLAISQNFNAIRYIGEDLINDNNYILKIIECLKIVPSNDLIILENIPSVLINRKDFILAIIDNNPIYFNFFCMEFKNDKNIAMLILKKDISFITYFNDNLIYNDEDILLLIIKEDPNIFNTANKNLQNNKKFILKAIKANFCVYNFINDNFKNDIEILQAYNAAKK